VLYKLAILLLTLCVFASNVFCLADIAQSQECHALTACTVQQIQTEKDFLEVCMALWTTIDLMQAIKADPQLKQEIVEIIHKDVKMLAQTNKEIVQNHDYVALLVALRESFKVVFEKLHSEVYVATLALFNGMIDQYSTSTIVQ